MSAPEVRSAPRAAARPRVAAVVLAAGASTRMGEPKPLVTLGGRTMLATVLDAVAGSSVDETVVVLGAEADRVRRAVSMNGVQVVENPRFAEGMSSSLRAGVAALSPTTDAFFVVLADAPFVRSSTFDALQAARERTGARIALPTYRGARGNPVLIDRSLADEVERITGDRGCRELRFRHPTEVVEVPVDDPGVLVDVDTPEEAARVRQALERGGDLSEVAGSLAERPGPTLDRLRPSRGHTRALEDILGLAGELDRRREPFCLAIVTRVEAPTSGKPGFKAIVRADGTVHGWVGGSCSRHALLAEARAALQDGAPRVLSLRPEERMDPSPASGVVERVLACQSGGSMDIYLEPHTPSPQLIVVGDSAVAESLCALGRLVGYRVIVAGPNLDASRFPDADEVVDDLETLPGKIDTSSYAVVATMAQYDRRSLELLVGSPAAYVALVASRRRSTQLLEELRASGVGEESLGRVRTPAGLDLGARTPEEIALSIAAEVVQRRRSSPAPPSPVAEPPLGTAATEVDPVCGMDVDPRSTVLTYAHEGRTFYFCSDGCLRRFSEAPGRFLPA